MHPSTTWASANLAKLLDSFAAIIAALNPTTVILVIILVIVITVAANSIMTKFAEHKPAVRRDIIKLVKALRRRTPKS
jgi:hypothetical protein